jgi:hypothetical protein
MSNDKQVFRAEDVSVTGSAVQVREGVLAIPGEIRLHFGGALESVSMRPSWWRWAASPHRDASGCRMNRAAAGGMKSSVPCWRSIRTGSAS